ncbi:MAG: PKD domain-containing protein [bacterium]|jgi:PKD repeat protein
MYDKMNGKKMQHGNGSGAIIRVAAELGMASVLVFILLLSSTCKSGRARAIQGAGIEGIWFAEEEIRAFPPPAGTDQELFEALRNELASALKNRGASAGIAWGTRLVEDLAYDPFYKKLSWTYKNEGDYDTSGDVGISDLTPIAQHYLARTSDSLGNDPLEAWIDGDGNGEIGVGDVTPIANNWQCDLKAYRFFTSQSIDGEFYRVGADVPFGEPGVFPKTFTVDAPFAMLKYLKVAPVDSQGNIGTMSEAVERTAAVYPPEVESVSPLSGNDGAQVTFAPVVSGTEPLHYYWDFGGGTLPPISESESPVVVLGAAGKYSCRLIVSNAAGEAEFPFTISVENYNSRPIAVLGLYPSFGPAPLSVMVDATGSNDPDGTIVRYQFDLDGDGLYETDNGNIGLLQHTYDTPGTNYVSLRVTDGEGATDATSKKLTVQTFTGGNKQPVASLVSSAQEGNAPLTVSFDASGSFDPDGTIVRYDWNFDGGLWDVLDGGPAQEYTYNIAHPQTTCQVRVTDDAGASAIAFASINVHGWHDYGWPVIEEGPSVGTFASLAVISDTPAVLYSIESKTKYARAIDIFAREWNAPIRLPNGIGAGQLKEIAGNPAFLYSDSNNGLYCFIRAADSIGDEWANPSPVISLDHIGTASGLFVSNGIPAFAYRDKNTKALMYIKADDELGNYWGQPTTVLEGEAINQIMAVSLIGKPAIVYGYNKSNDICSIKIIHSLNQEGTEWGEPMQALNPGFDGTAAWFDILVIDGIPCIVAGDNGYDDKEFWFSRANDAEGASWGAPVLIPVDINYWGYFDDKPRPQLSSVDGIPLVMVQSGSYSGGSVYYSVALDENGSQWSGWVKNAGVCNGGLSVTEFEGAPIAVYRYYYQSLGDIRPTEGVSGGFWR